MKDMDAREYRAYRIELGWRATKALIWQNEECPHWWTDCECCR